MPKIELENLSVTYLDRKHKEYPVLKNVSGFFDSGSINVITGVSGVGKTTLLRAIAGQFDYDGTILFDGGDILKPSAKYNIAYIDQQGFLFQNKIVYDILAFPLKQQRKKPEEIDREVKNIASLFGISNLLTRKPKQLSLGQRQKVAFAKAMIKNPDVCLFDEPFSNLDEESREFFLLFLRKTVKEKGTTVIITSHSEKEVKLLDANMYSLTEDGLIKVHDSSKKDLPPKDLEKKIVEENIELPINRKQLFKDILKNRYRLLISTGMMLFLFILPLIAVSLWNDLTLASFYADVNNYVDGSLTESGQSLYRSLVFNFILFYDLGFLLFSVGLAGVSRIFRQLCWGEGVQFFDSFKQGLKQNLVRFLALSFIFDIMITAICLLLFVTDAFWAVILVTAVSAFALLPIVLFCYGYSVIYANPFLKAFSNSALLAVKHYPTALCFSITCILPLLIEFLPYGLAIVKTILFFIYAIFLLPLLLLVGGLVLNSIFDKEINMENHKEIYHKGLF